MKTDRIRLALGAVFLGVLIWTIFQGITGWSRARYDAQLEELATTRKVLADLDGRTGALPTEPGATQRIPAVLLWLGPDQAADMQRKIVDLANQSGISLTSYGGSTGPGNLELPTVAFEVEAQSDYPALVRFLTGLERLEPRVSVGSLWINRGRPLPSQPSSATVTFRLMLWSFAASSLEAVP
jgi:hypothetical protein